MKKFYRIGSVILFALLLVLVVQTGWSSPNDKDKKIESQTERGEYLVNVGGCNDCHTPHIMTETGPAPDQSRLLSGHPADVKLPKFDFEIVRKGEWAMFSGDMTAMVGPWGVSYSANLTPDNQTGTGLWTPEIFKEALRTGKHMGKGRPILPPMPWFNLALMTDADLDAIFAYLRSLKPINNQVPAPIPAQGQIVS